MFTNISEHVYKLFTNRNSFFPYDRPGFQFSSLYRPHHSPGCLSSCYAVNKSPVHIMALQSYACLLSSLISILCVCVCVSTAPCYQRSRSSTWKQFSRTLTASTQICRRASGCFTTSAESLTKPWRPSTRLCQCGPR